MRGELHKRITYKVLTAKDFMKKAIQTASIDKQKYSL